MKIKKIGTSLIVCALVLAAFSLGSCKKEDDPGTNEVLIQGTGSDGFNPTSITVTKGTTITWINKQSVTHTVTSNDGVFDSGDLGKDKSFAFTFDSAGVYNYHCAHHSAMKASVTVE